MGKMEPAWVTPDSRCSDKGYFQKREKAYQQQLKWEELGLVKILVKRQRGVQESIKTCFILSLWIGYICNSKTDSLDSILLVAQIVLCSQCLSLVMYDLET